MIPSDDGEYALFLQSGHQIRGGLGKNDRQGPQSCGQPFDLLVEC